MAIITYSKKKNGNEKLSANFKVKEFACKDGTDLLKIDDKLIEYLQTARSFFGTAIYITSAYRTSSYNKKVGGASKSYHTQGRAVDHHAKHKINLYDLARLYEIMGCKGIIIYPNSNFVHIDTRTGKYFAIDYGKNRIEVVETFKHCNCNCNLC